MIVPGISQTLRRYQGNKVMACEKLYIWIVKSVRIKRLPGESVDVLTWIFDLMLIFLLSHAILHITIKK